MLNKRSRYFLFVTLRFAGFFQLMSTNTAYLNIVITDYINFFFFINEYIIRLPLTFEFSFETFDSASTKERFPKKKSIIIYTIEQYVSSIVPSLVRLWLGIMTYTIIVTIEVYDAAFDNEQTTRPEGRARKFVALNH